MKAYSDVAKQFRDQWHHPTQVPTVVKIWKIFCDKAHNDQFGQYRLSVERARNLPGGNSKRRWHGTIRACTVGNNDYQGFACITVPARSAEFSTCEPLHPYPQCHRCSSSLQSSFRLAKAGQRTNFGRFGAGIYTSATSSKADSYVCEKGGSRYKAMLLSDVILGKAIKMKTDNAGLKEAPAGYDSVIGEPGQALNYDEAIVYKNEAIRPLFLVIYT
ncbi:ADP-ribosylation [Fomitopsis betulina]|nr:ADP-ribosylation [Fomitopsis betulina]